MDTDDEFAPQPYAFLTSEAEFDEIFVRIRDRQLSYWADPAQKRKGEINHHDGGLGVYFEDPNGHLLEIITPVRQRRMESMTAAGNSLTVVVHASPSGLFSTTIDGLRPH